MPIYDIRVYVQYRLNIYLEVLDDNLAGSMWGTCEIREHRNDPISMRVNQGDQDHPPALRSQHEGGRYATGAKLDG